MNFYRTILAICLSMSALGAQSVPVNPGDALPNITVVDMELFQAGREEFLKQYSTPSPIKTRADTLTCGGCHHFSAIGGSDNNVPVPGWRATTPLFGAGLIEGIPDDAILALQNRPEAVALGVRGRAAMVLDSTTGRVRVGRFGWKGQHATLLDASAEGLSKYIGVPESVYANEVPDPATGLRSIDRLAAFARLLAPVGPSSALAAEGGNTFNTIGCSVCHIPAIVTAPPNVPATRIPINPFSDFLLHDVGTGEEIRTSPLWGLRLRRVLLHDGSAATLEDAIKAHKGEATIVRQRFDALPETARKALIEFLKTL
jgi:CxxC motif-containing protein (DUF1111 family)